jgi:hypothetical protein
MNHVIDVVVDKHDGDMIWSMHHNGKIIGYGAEPKGRLLNEWAQGLVDVAAAAGAAATSIRIHWLVQEDGLCPALHS